MHGGQFESILTRMGSKRTVLVGILCLLATVASAEISRVSPSSFTPSGEDYLTIYGSDLLGTTGTVIVFDDVYTVAEPNYATPTELVVWVPVPVLLTVGRHSVVVQSIDGDATRLHGPAYFDVTPVSSGPPAVITPESFSVEADGASGALVVFDVYGLSANGDRIPALCSPASGSQFSLGLTSVQCSATDDGGTATASFVVLVTDTLAPQVTVPADIVTMDPLVTFSASAFDNVDGPVAVTCNPSSGSTFPVGTTIVRCTATDSYFNSGVGFFSVRVTGGPPELVLPDDISVEATGAAGAVVTFVATAVDGTPVSCTPASGTTFAIDTTPVVCSASNAAGSTSGTFDVTVYDRTSPVLTLPGDITVNTTEPAGVAVSFVATAHDFIDGDVLVGCTPSSGSVFPIGVTTVLCTAGDTRNNVAAGYFDVTVNLVEDTTPPVLNLPAAITAEATSPSGAVVTFVATATDDTDGNVPVDCAPPSGSVFGLGTTTVTCTASDTSGNVASGSFDVTVEDTTPPAITSVVASPNTLWPPNHRMVDVTVTVTAVDAVDPMVVSRIVSVTSNQPVNGTGDGDTGPDWAITGPLTLQLRAERAGSNERIYTITVEAKDSSGNTSLGTVTVRVSGSKSRAVH